MLCKLDTQIDSTFKLKFVTIAVGVLDVILASVGSCGDKNDIYFLVTVLVVFSLSLLYLVCALLDVFKANCASRGMDFIFHLIGGILILIASIVTLCATDSSSCRVMEKTSAATVGVFNSFIYIYICWLILRLLRGRDQQPQQALPTYIFCGISSLPVLPVPQSADRNLSIIKLHHEPMKVASGNDTTVITTTSAKENESSRVLTPVS